MCEDIEFTSPQNSKITIKDQHKTKKKEKKKKKKEALLTKSK